MGRPIKDHVHGPANTLVGFLFQAPAVTAIRARALAEGLDASQIYRRLIRLGAEIEGLDLSGAGNHRPPSTNGNGNGATAPITERSPAPMEPSTVG